MSLRAAQLPADIQPTNDGSFDPGYLALKLMT
jgi:hypothetical protein